MRTQNTAPEPPNSICQELVALLPAYSLGVATPDEERLVQALLPFCPEAATILADYQVINDNLVVLVPSTEAPPSINALLERVRRAGDTSPVTRADSADLPPAQHVPASQIELQPTVSANHSQPPHIQPRRSRIWLALAACFLLAFIGTNLYWASQIDTLRREQQSFLQTLAASQTETAMALNTSNHHRALLPTDGNVKNSEASFIWNSTDQIGALVVNGLPSLKQGQTYQLWLVRDEQSLSLGTFEVDDQGVGVLIFRSAQPIETFSHIGVNVEPAGGTTKPTTPHLIIGNV
jgi:hypothetical protein